MTARPNRQHAADLLRVIHGTIGGARDKARRAPGIKLTLLLDGEVGCPHSGFTYSQVEPWLAANRDKSEIELIINSPGGSLIEAHRIYDRLRFVAKHGKKIITTASRACESAAVVVLLAGDLRRARPGARIMLHRPERVPKPAARWTADKHRASARLLDKVTAEQAELYASRTNRDKEFFLREMAHERPMSLYAAVEVGLLHEIEGVSEWHGGRPYTTPPGDYSAPRQTHWARQAALLDRAGGRRPLIW